MGTSISVPVYGVDYGVEGIWKRRSLSARENCIQFFKARSRGTTSLYLERELVETARELGLNISKVCEIALKQRIEALSFLEGSKKCGGREFDTDLLVKIIIKLHLHRYGVAAYETSKIFQWITEKKWD
ncbi:MAG: type II toxin-antitoxin system CcdA family antitoxin [Candidatus Bathyarchaeia archaeon]